MSVISVCLLRCFCMFVQSLILLESFSVEAGDHYFLFLIWTLAFASSCWACWSTPPTSPDESWRSCRSWRIRAGTARRRPSKPSEKAQYKQVQSRLEQINPRPLSGHFIQLWSHKITRPIGTAAQCILYKSNYHHIFPAHRRACCLFHSLSLWGHFAALHWIFICCCCSGLCEVCIFSTADCTEPNYSTASGCMLGVY